MMAPAVRGVPRWPLFLIASPAAVAVWSGWVGLGGMCGFGLIHPLPGIWDSAHLNTAITLPIGIESYGAYALGAWMSPDAPRSARAFARRSALAALTLGMAGQVVYHLLAAAHRARAPWEVVTFVSCLPVATLALATGLTLLLRSGGGQPGDSAGAVFTAVKMPAETSRAGDVAPAADAEPSRLVTAVAADDFTAVKMPGETGRGGATVLPGDVARVEAARMTADAGELIAEADDGPSRPDEDGSPPNVFTAVKTQADAGRASGPVPAVAPATFLAPPVPEAAETEDTAASGTRLAALPDLDGPDDAPAELEPALRAYLLSVAAGSPLSVRALAERHGISRRQAGKVVAWAREGVPA
jgi:hypothetical protein